MEAKTATPKRKTTGNTVLIQRVFDVPVSKVWRALTVAEEYKKWYGPEGYSCPYSHLEPKVGGQYRNCMRSPEGKDSWSTGIVKKIQPEKSLVVTDSFTDEQGNIINAHNLGMPGDWPDEMLITFELEEADGATKLKLMHEGIPHEARDDCVNGWNECFDKLERNNK